MPAAERPSWPVLARRPAAWRRVGWGLAWVLAGCSGGGGSADTPAEPPAPPNPPALKQVRDWNFDSASNWLLSAEPGGHAQAVVQSGRLAMLAQAYFSELDGSLQCPLVAAEVSLDLAPINTTALAELVIELQVTRWDLGLGQPDSNLPRLELVFGGHRQTIGVSGFKSMPGQARFRWAPAVGLQAAYDGVPSAGSAQVVPDTRAPMLRLWIDGCSQGLSQTLEIDRLVVLAR
jgi:hypothetical protein